MLELAIAFIASNIWTIGFLIAAIYNHFLRPEHKSITHMALLTVFIFAIAHITYSQWVSQASEPVKIHYIYLASSAIFLASALFVHNKTAGFVFYWPIKMAIGLMLFEAFLTLLVHVDRNIIALNFNSHPNFNRDHNWWLWTLRTSVSHINNILILISLFLPLSLLSKNKIPSIVALEQPKQSSIVQLSTHNGYRTIPVDLYIQEIDQAYNRVEAIQDLVNAMPEGEAKEKANQYSYTASELITRQDQSKIDHMHSINLLCNKARDCALYIDHLCPTEKLSVSKKNRTASLILNIDT